LVIEVGYNLQGSCAKSRSVTRHWPQKLVTGDRLNEPLAVRATGKLLDHNRGHTEALQLLMHSYKERGFTGSVLAFKRNQHQSPFGSSSPESSACKPSITRRSNSGSFITCVGWVGPVCRLRRGKTRGSSAVSPSVGHDGRAISHHTTLPPDFGW